MIRVRDLKDLTQHKGPRPFLYCRRCGAKYSAHAGDYWNAPDDFVLQCEENVTHGHKRNLVLAIDQTPKVIAV